MGKYFCTVENKWCKLLRKGVCKVANSDLNSIDKCPRVAAIETATLYDILKDVKFENVFERLCFYYPSQKDSKNGYQDVFDALLKKKPKKSHNLNDLFIAVYLGKEGEEEWLDVCGINKNKPDMRYGIEFCKWSDWVSMFITRETLDALSKEDIVAGCLYEMTFFGFTEEHVMDERKKLVEGVEAAKKAYKESKKNDKK